jgi:hypothetical protein
MNKNKCENTLSIHKKNEVFIFFGAQKMAPLNPGANRSSVAALLGKRAGQEVNLCFTNQT